MYMILATIAVITFVIYTVFNVIYLIDLRRTSRELRIFLRKTEANLNPALAELRYTLADIRKISGDLAAMLSRLQAAAGAVVAVEKTIQDLYGYYREGFTKSAQENIAALKAGFKAGVVSLVRNLKSKKNEASAPE